MFPYVAFAVLAAFMCFQISDGQIAFGDDQFSFGAPSVSGASDQSLVQDSTSPGLLNGGNNFQIRSEPSTSFSQVIFPESENVDSISPSSSSSNDNSSPFRSEPSPFFPQVAFPPSESSSSINSPDLSSSSNGDSFPIISEPNTSYSQASEPSSSVSSTNENSPEENTSLVANFVTEFNSAVYNSKVLPYLFNIEEMSPDSFNKFLYTNIFSKGSYVSRSNLQSIPNIDRVETYTSPMLLDIYSNAVAKYLSTEGILLNSSSTSLEARKYARILERQARRSFKRETPRSRFVALGDGFIAYLKSTNYFINHTMKDLVNYIANEVQRVGNKS